MLTYLSSSIWASPASACRQTLVNTVNVVGGQWGKESPWSSSAGENLVKMADRKIKTKVITFTPCDIDPSLGVEVKGFDDSIIEMNRIQEDILFGGDE